jgi:TolA-binding protein
VVAKVDEFLNNQNIKPEKRDQVTLLKAEALYKTKQYAAAIPVYERLQNSDLSPALKADALYKQGWCHIQLGDNSGAAEAFGRFIINYPNHKSMPTALAQHGMALQQTKNLAGALQDFNQLIAKFPTAKERELALVQKALILGQQQDNTAMAETFRQLLKDYPRSSAAAQANYWIGWSAYESKHYKDAIEPLENARKLNAAVDQRLLLPRRPKRPGCRNRYLHKGQQRQGAVRGCPLAGGSFNG